ncbi:MAG: T9SS type A sorting domain-containing protein, partial [Bacteroidota bacterium]|nr:T9SS type A sorting domain-containing protein [Bacteroidota bacterium]
VTFKSFTADRNHSTVVLKWATGSELNNSGFAIERNSNGGWQQVAFVPSRAVGGNSNNVLNYQYDDPNTVKGITQYRIRQVDIDARSTYSEIRIVHAEGQAGKTIVYPNPSSDGKVNIVFEQTEGQRDISLIDISGRVIKQWTGISNNNIQVDNLAPGMYSLRVVIRETGEQAVNKIIVNGR